MKIPMSDLFYDKPLRNVTEQSTEKTSHKIGDKQDVIIEVFYSLRHLDILCL